MTTVAVTGAAGMVGRALLERLDADPAVARIIGVDVREPEMPVAKLELRRADLHDSPLAHTLRDADVVVHLGDGGAEGTRRVLGGAEKAAAGQVVHLSSAAVYGARPDNPLPLTEDSPLRATPDHPPAYEQLTAEQHVAEWAASNAQASVCVLRPARVVGPGQDDAVSRSMESPRLVRVRGAAAPEQFLHVDDLAAALHLAVSERLRGPFNVAPDGWLSADEVAALLGRHVLELPEAVAFEVGKVLWRWRLSSQAPGALLYAMFPCVVDAGRLRAAGWAASRSNREVLREFAAEHHGYLAAGRVRVRRRDVYAGAIAASLATLARRRARRRRRAG